VPGPCGVRSGSPLGWHGPDGSGRGSGGGPGSWEGQGPRSKTDPPRSGGGVLSALLGVLRGITHAAERTLDPGVETRSMPALKSPISAVNT